MSEKVYYNIVDAVNEANKLGTIPFIWRGIKEGSMGYIFGPAKSGKTVFCENLALNLGTRSGSFLENDIIQKDYKTLIISFEENYIKRRDRNHKQLEAIGIESSRDIYLDVIREFPLYIGSNEDWELMHHTIEESGANIVIIDSLTRMGREIENSDNARNISLRLRDLTENLGITMIIIHHSPKLDGRPLTIDSMAGSRVISQEADFIYGINRTYHGIRYFKEVASRYSEESEKVVKFSIKDDYIISADGQVYENELFLQQDGRSTTGNVQLVYECCRDLSESSSDRTIDIKELKDRSISKMSYSTLYANLEKLLDNGTVTRTEKGKYTFNEESTS